MAKRLKSAARTRDEPARRRGAATRKSADAGNGQPAAQESPAPPVGMATQIFGAQRKLWDAGLSALSRGSKVGGSMGGAVITESLQGGLKKLEEVFDQRVLNALAHAGMPTPAELCKLLERVEILSAEVSRLKRKQTKG